MLKKVAALLLMTQLSACAVAPVATSQIEIPPGTAIDQTSTLWADNTNSQYMYINKVDERKTFKVTDKNPPYSVTVMPGRHVLSVHINDVSNPYPLIDKYANMEVSIDAEPGQNYVLRMLSDGRHVSVVAESIGKRSCQYVVVGSQLRGYLPVRLECS